jgi:hypothetical protein
MDFLAQVIAELIRLATFQPQPTRAPESKEDELPATVERPEE